MNDVTRSKLLSLLLRHKPEEAGLILGEGGWVSVDDLLAGLQRLGKPMTRADIDRLVRTSDKQRFTLSEDSNMIRAAQGHSVDVEMNHAPAIPITDLYHGTAHRFLDAILASGLAPMSRQHVHLSSDVETAVRVGQRHGRPVVLRVDAERMHADGYVFFRADNGVWLTNAVPAGYLDQISN